MGTPAATTASPTEDQPRQQLVRVSKASTSSSSSQPEDQPPPSSSSQLAPPAPLAPSSNVTAEMRKRGATATHRGSLPSALEDVSSSMGGGSSSSSRRNRVTKAPTSPSVPAVVLDRRLLQKYEEINSEIARLTRLSRLDQLPPPVSSSKTTGAPPPSNESETMLRQVTAELRKARRSSSQAIQSQKELIDKLERQEKSSLRRFFSLHKESKVEKIKSKLCDKLSEAVHVDEELQRLERQSDALARTSLASSFNAHSTSAAAALHASYSYSSAFPGLQSVAEVEDEIASLEREKEDVLNSLFSALKSPDVQDLHARIASYACEIHACQSIAKQVDRCATMYRQALQLLSVALATVVSPHYSGSVKEFTQSAYPLAVEASHLIEAAAHGIQPESRRRYDAYAPELVGVRPPKFPQAIIDYARRARATMDPNSSLALEAMRKLRGAENVLMLLQRLVIEKAEVVDAWKQHVERDQEQAERGHAYLEKRLQEQVAVLARSVSV